MDIGRYYQWLRDVIAAYVIVTGRTTPRAGTSDNVKMRRRLIEIASTQHMQPDEAVKILIHEGILKA